MAKFGKLIHKYTIKDGAIVPLIYEGRFVDQKADEENNDLWFKQTTKRLTDAQKEDLRKKWSSIRRLTSTDARIKRIALDISEHFTEGYKNTGFKAMLTTNYKRDAIRYPKCFEQFGDLNCAVVISPSDMRESVDDADEGTDDLVIAYWDKMMRQYGDADHYEEAIKNKFCDREMQTIPAEQLRAFLVEARASGVYEMYYTELATGLRRGELLGLKWSDVDLEAGVIRVNRQIARVDGQIVEAPLKTKNSYRTVAISQQAAEVLRQQKEKTNDEYVFPSPNGGSISPDSVNNMLKRVLARAGIPRVRFHDLRHTFATVALQVAEIGTATFFLMM